MAIRTISAAGGNYNAVGTWDEGVVPTSADDVVVRADGTSGSVTVTAAAAAKTLNLSTGPYDGTFTINDTFTLTVAGSVTLNSSGACTGISGTGTGTLNINVSAASLTSNGKTIASRFSYTPAGGTLTLVDDAIVTGRLDWSGASTPVIAGSGRTITASGGVNTLNRAAIGAGCTLRITGGTCTSSTRGTNYGISGSGTVEFDGDITMSSLFVRASTIRYISGTWGAGTFNIGSSPTLHGSPPVSSMAYRTSGTLTLMDPLTLTGTLTVLDAVTLTAAGAQSITVPILTTSGAGSSILNLGDCAWIVGLLRLDAANTLSIRQADLTVDALTVDAGSVFTFEAGRTLTVVSTMRVAGSPSAPVSIASAMPGAPFTLDLASTDLQSVFAAYADVYVAAPRILYNAFGGALTNTSRIENKDNTTMLGVDPGESNVLYGVGYVINGVALTGTMQLPTSHGSI